jgi:hypothetical protein
VNGKRSSLKLNEHHAPLGQQLEQEQRPEEACCLVQQTSRGRTVARLKGNAYPKKTSEAGNLRSFHNKKHASD